MYITWRYAESYIKISWRNSNVVTSGKWRRVELQWQRNDAFITSFAELCVCVCVCVCVCARVQSCLTQLHRLQPPRLPHPWDSPGKNTGVGCHFLLQCMKMKSEREVAQSCPTLSNPMDCSPPGSSVHGIFQARVLE